MELHKRWEGDRGLVAYVVRSEDYRLFIKRLGVVVDSVNPADPKDLEYAVNILKQGLRDRIASLTVMLTVGVS